MMQRIILAGALSCAVLAAAGCTHPGNARGWQLNRSKNVALYTEAKLEHEFIQEWLELSHAAMQAFFPEVKTGTVDAVWLKNEPGSGTRLYSPLDDPRAGWTLEALPSGGRIGGKGLIVLERRLEGWTFRPVRDEFVAKEQMAHLFINKAVPMAPLWLQVGLGRYLHKFRIHYEKDYWLACFGSPWFDEPVGGGAGRSVNVGVADIFATDWYQYDRRKRHWYEFTSYAFVHYLLHGKGMNKDRFFVLLRALRQGQSTEQALATAYPQVLPDEWDDRLDEHIRPPDVRARIANERYLPQGLCFRIPPARYAEKRPEKSPANEQEIELLLSDLEQVSPFRRHAGWWPLDIVLSEAAKRPGRVRRPAGQPGRPGGGQGDGKRRPLPDDGTPMLRTSPGEPQSAPPPPPPPSPSAPPSPPAQPAAPPPPPEPELPPD